MYLRKNNVRSTAFGSEFKAFVFCAFRMCSISTVDLAS